MSRALDVYHHCAQVATDAALKGLALGVDDEDHQALGAALAKHLRADLAQLDDTETRLLLGHALVDLGLQFAATLTERHDLAAGYAIVSLTEVIGDAVRE